MMIFLTWGLISRAEAQDESSFIRLSRTDKGQPLSLDVSILPFTGTYNNRPVQVDLVSAVHVGEKSYYEELNRRFGNYEVVLFELIADPGVQIKPQKSEERSAISNMQIAIKDLLKLDFQLEQIDYGASNLVHADMSPAEFSKSMSDRGESFSRLFLQAFAAAYSKQAKEGVKPPDLSSIFLLFFEDARALALRRILAQEFENMEGLLSTLNGKEGSTILTERNRRALEVLGNELEKGRSKLAIFYGGAHMPDFTSRLKKDFGLTPGEPEWLVSWHLAAQR